MGGMISRPGGVRSAKPETSATDSSATSQTTPGWAPGWQVGAPVLPAEEPAISDRVAPPAPQREPPGRETDDSAKGERGEGECPRFDDVPASSPDCECIQAVVEAGIMRPADGEKGFFRPQTPVTRRELAEVLCRAAGWSPLFVATATFSDVGKDARASRWVERLVDKGVMTADAASEGANRFRPDAEATRAEVAEALCLVRGWAERAHAQPVFEDVATKDKLRGHIERLYDEGAVKGSSAKPLLYRPGAACTRAELATLICRAYGLHRKHQPSTGEQSK